MPTLETVVKKTKAIKPDLSLMIMDLADCIQATILCHFSGIFDSKCAIITTITFSNTQKCNRLTDVRFEKFMLIRYNKNFVDL